MWLQVVVVCVLSFYSFGDFLSRPRVRTTRQNFPKSEDNNAIEFFNNCSCVFYYQCDTEGFIITSGEGLLEERLGEKKSKRILCIGDVEGQFVCCKHKPGEENKEPVTTSSTLTGSVTARTTEASIQIRNSTKSMKTCGRQLPDINERILNDSDNDESTPVDGEFPWIAAIFKEDAYTNKWSFRASGSLIHPKVVLTANHVVVSSEAKDLKVIINGRIQLIQIGKNLLQERNVKEIIKHPEYNSGMLHNDVALLLLNEPYDVQKTPFINTLCLKPNMSFENKRCIVAGWGKSTDGDETVKVLKKVDLPTLPHSKCEELLGKALNKKNYEFHESLMCAGGEQGKDACKGDGGSPLMCPTGTTNHMYQVGIVAWGIGCGKKDVPGVYANVQFLHKWIVDQLKERTIEIN